MASLQFEPMEQDNLFSIVASVLHVGNVDFISLDNATESAVVTQDSKKHLDTAAHLLQIDISVSGKASGPTVVLETKLAMLCQSTPRYVCAMFFSLCKYTPVER